MKKLLFILLLAILSGEIRSQVVFCPPGAEWHYSYYRVAFATPVFKWSNEQIKYVADSVVNNDTLKILEHIRYFKTQNNLLYPTAQRLTSIKQKGDTIFFRNAGTANGWQILYNYAALPGQGWQNTISIMPAFTTVPSGPLAITYTVTVDSVATVMANAVPLRRLYARYKANIYNNTNLGNSLILHTDTVTIDERMGCSQFLFNFHNRMQTNEYKEYFLGFLCYSDSTFGTKQLDADRPCDYMDYTGVSEAAYQNSGIRIFPNPVAASFRIGSEQGAFPDGCTLNLSDVCGRTVKQLVLKDLQQEVLVADLEDGIYLLSLSRQGKTVYTTRLVKKSQQ